jgi:hypothetical protein
LPRYLPSRAPEKAGYMLGKSELYVAVHGIQRIRHGIHGISPRMDSTDPTDGPWVQAAGCEQHVSHPSPRSSNTLQCRREGDGMGPWAMEAEGP